MRSASFAEWLISRFTTKKRADAIVGDLVELQSEKGPLWFWVSLTGIAISLSWRPGLRLIAAFCVRVVALAILWTISFSQLHLQHWPPSLRLLSVLNASCSIGALLWMVLTYAGVRYGLRDRVTQLALAWASLGTVAIYFWREPMVLFLCVAVSIGMVSVSIPKMRYRRATLVLGGTVASGYAAARLMDYLGMLYWHPILHSGQVKSHVHLLMGLNAIEFLVVTWIAVMTCSRMYHWLQLDEPLDEKAEKSLA